MPTTVTHSIGTASRDYSTLQAWHDAGPADLTTADQLWRGECYNDSEFTSTSTFLTVSKTTDATRYFLLTTAAGQGFRSAGGIATAPLRYDQSKGVGVRFNGGYATMFSGSGVTGLVIDGLQIYYDSGSASNYAPAVYNMMGVQNCIIETRMTSGFFLHFVRQIINSVVVVRGTSFSGDAVRTSSGTDRIINSTIVRPSDLTAGGKGIDTQDGFPQVTNCAVFNFTTNFVGTIASYAAGSGNNASSVATTSIAGGSGGNNQGSLTFSTQFQSTADSTRDWRAASGGALTTTGVRAQTYTNDLDIIGASRSTTTPSIGAREYAVAAPPPPPVLFRRGPTFVNDELILI